MKLLYRISIGVFATYAFLHPAKVFACSSCGSGGDDPLILYPSDQTRVYFGVTTTKYDSNVSSDGQDTAITGVRSRERMVLSLGRRLNRKSFVTLSMPQVTNHGKSETKSGVGDPALAVRYDVINQDFSNPAVPQVQFLAGFKPKMAKSTYNADDQREFLDAFGTGHHNGRVGVDVWSGMTRFQYGFGYNFIYPVTETYNGETVKPGNLHTSNITIGATFARVKTVAGIVRTEKERIMIAGEDVENSSSLQHNLFTTITLQPKERHDFRLTVVDEGRYISNYNTTSGLTFTGAYIFTL